MLLGAFWLKSGLRLEPKSCLRDRLAAPQDPLDLDKHGMSHGGVSPQLVPRLVSTRLGCVSSQRCLGTGRG